ncbi:MAG: fasciclin domain-containing protein [Actinobacteria bacterium]|nr:fasciclin domain-containing protein [Actinomycetota bacterium]
MVRHAARSAARRAHRVVDAARRGGHRGSGAHGQRVRGGDRRRGRVRFEDSTVVEPDIAASNAVVHAVDSVLIEPSIMDDLAGR